MYNILDSILLVVELWWH